MDHLQVLTKLIENLKLYIIFVNFAKAFDSVEYVFIQQALQYQVVNQKYTRLLGKQCINKERIITG